MNILPGDIRGHIASFIPPHLWQNSCSKCSTCSECWVVANISDVLLDQPGNQKNVHWVSVGCTFIAVKSLIVHFEYNLKTQAFAHWETFDEEEYEELDDLPYIHPHPKHVLPLIDTNRGETGWLHLSVSCRTSKREVNENLTMEIAQAIVGQLIALKMNAIILNIIHGNDNMMHWTTNNGQCNGQRKAVRIIFQQGSGI